MSLFVDWGHMRLYYQDDYVTLYHGSCRDPGEWLSGDVMVTDPPYGIGWEGSYVAGHGRGPRKIRRDTPDGIANDGDTTARDEALALWSPRPAMVFGSFRAAPPAGVVQTLIYQKPATSGVVGSYTGFRRDIEPVFLVGDWPRRSVMWSSVLSTNVGHISHLVKQFGHPHVKPVDLLRDMILKCPPGVIVDPFAGSGSTLRAAKDLGRKAIGVELDERYCEIAAERLGQEVLDFGGVA